MTMHGVDIFAIIKGAIIARLNANIAALSTAHGITTIHDTHASVSIVPPCISVDVDKSEQDFTGATSQLVKYHIVASVRVHSGFVDGFFNTTDALQSANSVLNYIRELPELSSEPRVVLRAVDDVMFNRTFEETATRGSEIILRNEMIVLDGG